MSQASAPGEAVPTPQRPVPARELAGLCAVVTGASSGIGRAIAVELASAGARLLVHAGTSRIALEGTARECSAFGEPALPFLADLSEPAARDLLVGEAFERLPAVDIWVNNAGADVLTGRDAELCFERKLDRLWRVDVCGTVVVSRAVGRRMIAAGRPAPVILNMGWDQAESGMEGESGELFATTKGAVMAFTRSLALSLAPQVRVNCLAPGWIRTSWGETASPRWQERVRRETPLARWGSPDDVASLARFLVSPRSSYITGQVIAVNGGAVR